MDFDNDLPEETIETGSDELLSHDNLRLPEDASPLVRLHAVRAWLARRQKETGIEIGMAAIEMQNLQRTEASEGGRLRRRELQAREVQVQHAQQVFQDAQQRLHAYEDAEALLEESVNHITISERLLVEYYLATEELVQQGMQEDETVASPRVQALIDVLHRVEHVTVPGEEG